MPRRIEDRVYHEFDEAAVRDLLGIGIEDSPVGLVVHGVYDMPRFAQRWRDRPLGTGAPRGGGENET